MKKTFNKLVKSLKLHWKIKKIPLCWAFRLCGVKVPKSLQWIIGTNTWRIPTDDDFKDLEMHLGMSQADADSEDDFDYRGTNEGSKIAGKSALWDSGALKSDGDFGASGLNFVPSGTVYPNGLYEGIGMWCDIWSSTPDGTDAYLRDFYYIETGILRATWSKNSGYSIYLVRDLEAGEDADANGTVYEDDYTGNDGKTYNAVKQGNQVWLNEPLKETKFRDNTLITLAGNDSEWNNETGNSNPVRREPNDDDTKVDDYGYLYSFYTIESAKGLVNPGEEEKSTNFFKFF